MALLAAIVLPGLDGSAQLRSRFGAALAQMGLKPVVLGYPTDCPGGYGELGRMVEAALPVSGKFILVGESFSGPLACELAAAKPPGLAGLVLCASFVRYPLRLPRAPLLMLHRLPARLLPDRILSMLLLGTWSTPQHLGELKAAVAALPSAIMVARLRQALAVDARAALKAIAVPTLVLQASADRLIPRSAATQILELLPSARLHQLPGPHSLLQACPTACAQAIRDYVRSERIDPFDGAVPPHTNSPADHGSAPVSGTHGSRSCWPRQWTT